MQAVKFATKSQKVVLGPRFLGGGYTPDLGARYTSDLILMVSFTFTMRLHLIRLGLHQRHLYPSVWRSLVGLRLLSSVCDAWQRSRTKNLRRVGKNFASILSFLRAKVYKKNLGTT